MANPFFGFGSYMQWARDEVWGTFPTITRRFPIYSANARAIAGRIRPATMDGTLAQPALVKGMQMCELDLSIPLCYSNQMLFWDAIMGTSTYASNGGTTAGSNPYTHTWSGFKALMNSLSFEIIQGQAFAASPKCIRCVGMKVQRATIKGTAGVEIADQMMRMDLKMVGYAMTENETITGSFTAATLDPVLSIHQTVQTDISQASTVAAGLDWELVIDTMVKERPFMEGSGYISEPQRERRPQWTLTMTREFQVRTALTAFLANSGGAFQSIFTVGSLALQFDGYGAMEKFPENPIEDEGWIKQKIQYTGYDTSGATLAVAVTNTQSSITA